MEILGFDLAPLITGLVGVLVGALTIGWEKIGNLVATSETTIDDAVYKALDKALKEQAAKAE